MNNPDQPVIAAKGSIRVDLEEGKTYYWCACGRSQNQPWCDGSHKGTSFSPVAFTPEKSGKRSMCQCKHSGTEMYCDGSHKEL